MKLFSDDRRFLFGPKTDLLAFALPTLVAILWTLVFPRQEIAEWEFLLWVVLVDVAHVWTSVLRVYGDRDAFAERPKTYLALPFVAFFVGIVLHSVSALVFWRVLAYVALFHFIRQQVGFARLAFHRAGSSEKTRKTADVIIYASTILPVLHWHLGGTRNFHWFVDGDFLAGPNIFSAQSRLVAQVLAAICIGASLIFGFREWMRARKGDLSSIAAALIVVSTAIAWSWGILLHDSDRIFTVTNVLPHGIAYFVLTFRYWLARRKQERQNSTSHLASHARIGFAWIGLALLGFFAIAFVEELGWNRWIYGEHPSLFGMPNLADESWFFVLVPLLSVPQFTHYLLDGIIWRSQKSNTLRSLL